MLRYVTDDLHLNAVSETHLFIVLGRSGAVSVSRSFSTDNVV